MTPFLADDLLLLAHDPRSGRLRLPEAEVGAALAAALLAELVLSGSVGIDRGGLAIADRTPPADELSEELYVEVVEELSVRPVSAVNWIMTRRQVAIALVVERLVRAGYVRVETQRRLGRTSSHLLATRPGEALLRTQRLAVLIGNRAELQPEDILLARLTVALTGGARRLGLEAPGRSYLDWRVSTLAGSVLELIGAAEAAIRSCRPAERPARL